MTPKTGGSLSCNHSFSLRFLSPGVNVLCRGRGFHANDRSDPVETLRYLVRRNCVTVAVKAQTPCVYRCVKKCVYRASYSPASH
jgi:hypothetical protein